MPNTEYAKIIADSISPSGRRITSIEVKYWRNLHCELLTHRMFARNTASSRAIPVTKTFEKVLNGPFIPEFIGKEQKGMVAGEELSVEERLEAERLILEMRDFCLSRCHGLKQLGVHKSIINRYLESWSYITVLITATNWGNFFRLRCHPAAEKHLNKAANLVREAMNESVPKLIPIGGWHLPYIREEDYSQINRYGSEDEIQDLVKVSAGRSARLSYLTQDGRRDLQEDVNLHNRLVKEDPKHASALEHPNMCLENPNEKWGCMVGWRPYRMMVPNESVREKVL